MVGASHAVPLSWMAASRDGEALYFKDPQDELLCLPKRDDFLDLERQLVRTGRDC